MKIAGCFLILFFCSLAAADAFDFIHIGGQSVVKDDEKPEPVKGENPLEHCNSEHKTDILILERVDVDPNPPTRYELLGRNLEDASLTESLVEQN